MVDFLWGRHPWKSLPPYWNSGLTKQGIYLSLFEGETENHILWFADDSDIEDAIHGYLWLSPQTPTHSFRDLGTLCWRAQLHPYHRQPDNFNQMLHYAEAHLMVRNQALPIQTFGYGTDSWVMNRLKTNGYRQEIAKEVYMQRSMTGHLPQATVPDGFTIKAFTKNSPIGPHAAAMNDVLYGDPNTTPWMEENIRNMLRFEQSSGGLHFVAETPHGEVAAFVTISLDEITGLAEFDQIGTRPQYRRAGLANALLSVGLEAVQQHHDVRYAVVRAACDNIPALVLYQGAGFKIIDTLYTFSKSDSGNDY